MSATVTIPGAAATTGSLTSSTRFQSMARLDGLWLARVVPVHFSPQGNGISKVVTGSATAGAATATMATVPSTASTPRRTRIRPSLSPTREWLDTRVTSET